MSRSSDGKSSRDSGKINSEKGVRVEIVSFVGLVLILRQLCGQD